MGAASSAREVGQKGMTLRFQHERAAPQSHQQPCGWNGLLKLPGSAQGGGARLDEAEPLQLGQFLGQELSCRRPSGANEPGTGSLSRLTLEGVMRGPP